MVLIIIIIKRKRETRIVKTGEYLRNLSVLDRVWLLIVQCENDCLLQNRKEKKLRTRSTENENRPRRARQTKSSARRLAFASSCVRTRCPAQLKT